jgi:hypothetical protein
MTKGKVELPTRTLEKLNAAKIAAKIKAQAPGNYPLKLGKFEISKKPMPKSWQAKGC